MLCWWDVAWMQILSKYGLAPTLGYFKECSKAEDARRSTAMSDEGAAGGSGGFAHPSSDVPSDIDPSLDDTVLEAAVSGDGARTLLLQLGRLGYGILRSTRSFSEEMPTSPTDMSALDATLMQDIIQDTLAVRDHAFPWVSRAFCFRACLSGMLACPNVLRMQGVAGFDGDDAARGPIRPELLPHHRLLGAVSMLLFLHQDVAGPTT